MYILKVTNNTVEIQLSERYPWSACECRWRKKSNTEM